MAEPLTPISQSPIEMEVVPPGPGSVSSTRPDSIYTAEQLSQALTEVQAEYPHKICSNLSLEADSRTLKICRLHAGFGTNHKGSGKCKFHGGRAGAPIKHGLYSDALAQHPTLQSLYEEYQVRGETVKGLGEETTLLKMFVAQLIQQLNDGKETAGMDAPTRDRLRGQQIDTMERVINAIDKLRKLVESTHHIESEAKMLMTFENLSSLCWQLLKIIGEEVKDAELQKKIFKRFATEVRFVLPPNQ